MPDPVTRLNVALEGRYSIDRELGEGGMATVYLADDLKHERKVALKVLKPELAAVVGAGRFLAEIKTTANLQHPHILPLHDSGEADNFLFYVMPFVEGETLRDRIDREKQLPVDEAVALASKVAGALQHAHEHGVIHRDIKPGNILIQGGEPVVADFGIALAVGAAGGSRLTETGLSVGTPYYMSPEQATGDQHVGPPSDTYALGAVLYEMLIGDPPYMGSTAQAVLGQIIAGEAVSATKKRGSVPANVDAALRCALEKLPADRFTSAQDFVRALGDPHFQYGELDEAPVGASAGSLKWLAVTSTTTTAILAVALGMSILGPDPPQPVSRFEINLPDGIELFSAPGISLAVSPDGSTIVFVGTSSEGVTQLWLRPLEQLSAMPIPGSENARSPRFSPDGQSIAFTVGEDLRIASLTGAPPQTLFSDVLFPGLAWGPDGMIYFTGGHRGISRVSVGGGEPEEVTTVAQGESDHVVPDVLPNGKGLLFTRRMESTTSVIEAEIALVSLETGRIDGLFPGRTAKYAPSGHIVYASREGTLLAVPFDVDRLEPTGPAGALLESVSTSSRYSKFALSETGVLLYLPGAAIGAATELVWVTRQGDAAPVDPDWQFDPPVSNYGWSLSPDGARVALTREIDGNTDIWVKQLPDGPLERLTFGDENDLYPVWTSDGQSVTYLSSTDSWRRPADGTGTPELLLDDQLTLFQGGWSPDGEWMVFRTGGFPRIIGVRDIVGFRPGVDSATVPLVATAEFAEQDPALSSDGRWLAYTSNRTGRAEIYVSPFPEVGSARVPVSTGGGVGPLWARSGSELFFVDADRRLIAARVETDSEFRVLDREPLFILGPEYLIASLDGTSHFYDISLDDQQFLMGRSASSASIGGGSKIVVVQNFFEELKERAGN